MFVTLKDANFTATNDIGSLVPIVLGPRAIGIQKA